MSRRIAHAGTRRRAKNHRLLVITEEGRRRGKNSLGHSMAARAGKAKILNRGKPPTKETQIWGRDDQSRHWRRASLVEDAEGEDGGLLATNRQLQTAMKRSANGGRRRARKCGWGERRGGNESTQGVDLLIWGGRRRQTRSWTDGRCGQDSARGKNNCWSARARARGPAGICCGSED